MQSNIQSEAQRLADIQQLSDVISSVEFAPEVAASTLGVPILQVRQAHNELVIQRSILEFQKFYNNL